MRINSIPIYIYEHPKTGELFEVIRSMKDRKKKYVALDGEVCIYVEIPPAMGYCGRSEKDREGFELDPDYYKRQNPKYVKYRDGHREFFDPTRHR